MRVEGKGKERLPVGNGGSMLARLLIMFQSCWPRLGEIDWWGHLESWIQGLKMEYFNAKRGAEVVEMKVVDLMMWHTGKRGLLVLSGYVEYWI